MGYNITQDPRQYEERNKNALLHHLGLKAGKDRIRCPMPWHNDSNPSFGMTDKGRIICTCSELSNSVSLLDACAMVSGIDPKDFVAVMKHAEGLTGDKFLSDKKQPKPRMNGKAHFAPQPDPEAEARRVEQEAADQAKMEWCASQVQHLQMIKGTPAEMYLRDHRGLGWDLPLEFTDLGYMQNFRFREGARSGEAMVAIVRTADGDVCGLQGLYLNTDGTPRLRQDGKKHKYSAGPIGRGHVTLKSPVTSDTVAIAEGIETGLTRLLAGPATIHVTLGKLRNTLSEGASGRVEIIADVDKTIEARKLAREVARKSPKRLRSYAVTVPRLIGDKADLNDLLQEEGSEAVQLVVDDADRITSRKRSGDVEELDVGSDEEIAQRVLQNMEDMLGRVQFCEGHAWAFDGRIWEQIDNSRLSRQITRFDGAYYDTPSGSIGRVSMTSNKVKSVRELMFSKAANDDFFKNAPEGIPCLNCFISFQKQPDGSFEPVARMHARKQRARHIVNATWPAPDADERMPGSDLMKLMNGLFDAQVTKDLFAEEGETITDEQAQKDLQDRQDLIFEIAATAALGRGTSLRHPTAVLFLGRGGAGKSTVAEVTQSLIPAKHRASVPPSKMGQDYFVAKLQGKALNVAEEASERDLQGDAFKRIITGNTCHARLPF